jgi:hypothetical protein
MVGNILEMLTSGAGKDLIGPAAKLLGESETGVQSAVTSLLPVLLGGMTQKASTTGGAADLFKMVTGANVDTGLLGNIAGALGGAGSSALTSVGSSLLSGLFGGDKSSMLGNALASVTGIKPSSATSLLGMATPLVFGAIKKLVSSQNLDAGGLANLLLGQKGNLAKANIDPRLSSVLGTGWMDKLPASLATVAPAAVRSVTPPPPPPASSGLGKWLPWLAALIGAFLLWQWLGKGPETKPVAPAPAPAATPAPAPAPAPAPVATGLPQSVFFEVGKFDIGDEGKKAIADAFAAAGKDGKVSLTGFTDKTGDQAANEELAKNRAKAVKEALMAAGLGDGNIEMRAPEFVTGSSDDRAARRVDIVKAN